ncbi:uncharacterized protein F5891DRAFT_937927, partial [Suillus fuscotomentosus]
VLCPPTTYLPPIAKIASFSVAQLLDALTYLQSLYHPEVRGSRRQRVQVPVSNGEQNLLLRHEDSDDSGLQAIRSDAFERSYSTRWLTTLIAQLEVRQDLSHSEEVSLDDLGTPEPTLAYTLEAQLTDIPLDNNDQGSVGVQNWGAACVLAEIILEDPERFGLDSSSHGLESRRLNVLKLGAGTGLVSLVVMKLLDALPSFNHRKVHVVATDFHPSVLANLRSNVSANVSSTHDQITSTHSITTHFLDWSSFSTTPRPDCLS